MMNKILSTIAFATILISANNPALSSNLSSDSQLINPPQIQPKAPSMEMMKLEPLNLTPECNTEKQLSRLPLRAVREFSPAVENFLWQTNAILNHEAGKQLVKFPYKQCDLKQNALKKYYDGKGRDQLKKLPLPRNNRLLSIRNCGRCEGPEWDAGK